MSRYWLIPILTPPDAEFNGDLVEIYDGTRSNAARAAETLERKLNGGRTWDEIASDVDFLAGVGVVVLRTTYIVTPTPYSIARNKKNFKQWACNNTPET